ncbi:MAG: ABC-type sugar transport system, permease component [Devosia sp.]|nr:ABC-type sugar transport system, permease component [Devosia sp.]
MSSALHPAAQLARLPGWVALLLWTAVVVLPLYVLVVSCFKTTAEIYINPMGLPASWSPTNFITAWHRANLGQNLVNSLIVTVGAVVVTLLVSAMAAYPLSRFRLRWGTAMLGLFLVGIMLPIRLASVELFTLMADLNLLDSLFGLVCVYVAIRIPFAIFIFANFMRVLPRELEEAARLDGANDLQILFGIILPVVMPAISIVAIFTAIAVWNDFFFPLIFIFDNNLKTVPLAITSFVGQFRTDWGMVFAALAISLAPVLAMYLVLARQIREGAGAGGVIT